MEPIVRRRLVLVGTTAVTTSRRATGVTALLWAMVALCVTAAAPGSDVALAAPAPARPVGGGPLDDVLAAANADARPACGLTAANLAALMLAVVFPETGAMGSQPPSPMTMGRFDVNASLYAFGDPSTPFQRAYWSPGVGMWAMDSAGLGRAHAAPFYMNTATAAPVVARWMANEFCRVRQATNPDDATLRAAVWRPWLACRAGACEAIFAELFDSQTGQLRPQTRFENVSRTGGLQFRRCFLPATMVVLDCALVDSRLAEGFGAGSVAWARPSYGTAPLSLPFYAYELGGREYRHWLHDDTRYGGDINGSRSLSSDARNGGVTWSSGPAVCDLTLGRGGCLPEPPLGSAVPVTPNDPRMAGPGSGVGAVGDGDVVIVAERRGDGRLRRSESRPPLWTGWGDLGGIGTSDPDVALVDGAPHVVVRGMDDAAWWHDGGGWRSLGGVLTSAPAIASSAPGRMDVVARGTDGAVWTSAVVNGSFTGWHTLGGFILGDPEVTSWGPDRLDIFAVGGDQALWHRARDGSTWYPWEPIGGILTSSPSSAAPAAGQLGVAARHRWRRLRHWLERQRLVAVVAGRWGRHRRAGARDDRRWRDGDRRAWHRRQPLSGGREPRRMGMVAPVPVTP